MPFGIKWKTIGLICGACAAPFTGGASLAACVACSGAGLVAGHFLGELPLLNSFEFEVGASYGLTSILLVMSPFYEVIPSRRTKFLTPFVLCREYF